MSLKLEDVKGLGKKVDLLKDVGIDSVEKLANAKPEVLIEIKGIGKASAVELINKAKKLLNEKTPEAETKKESTEKVKAEEEKKIQEEAKKIEEEKKVQEEAKKIEEEKKVQEEVKKLEEKRKQLEGKKVEDGDFILVKITGKTQKGKVFQVSSVDDAKKAGIYDEKRDQQGYYTPEFVIVGKPGFLNEGLTETIKEMKYFEKKSVRIPPTKAFGKRDPTKIERIGIAKFKKLNNGKNPEIGQEFVKQTQQGTVQRGVVTSVTQGKVIVDYNHPLAGQSVDYNLEIIDKIEDFNEKIAQFMINKGIPKNSIKDFNISYNPEKNSIEFTIPKMFLFQNLTYIKLRLAMDLQSYMGIGDVIFIEVFEKLPVPTPSTESVMKKVEEFNKQEEAREKEEKPTQEKEK